MGDGVKCLAKIYHCHVGLGSCVEGKEKGYAWWLEVVFHMRSLKAWLRSVRVLCSLR